MAAIPEDLAQTVQPAAKRLTGHPRRLFQAEMAPLCCGGSPRLAEHVFGWGRAAIDTSLHELRITVPMLGPVPIALDFGFPLARTST